MSTGSKGAFAAVAATTNGRELKRWEQIGLTKREYFAVHLPAPDLSKLTDSACSEQCLPASPSTSHRGAWELWRNEVTAILRVRQADALLVALERGPDRSRS